MKRLPIDTIVATTTDCREVIHNYKLKPYRYILKGYKKYYDEICAKIVMLDYGDNETGWEYLVPADKIYKI